MLDPLVDVTIAVHSRTRPIARAVASVLDHTSAPVRVNVVAHNIDPEIIRENLGAYAEHPGLRLLHYEDGIPSPAGPMNHGFAQSTARFMTLLGSDDEFAPGAIDSWLALQQETGADFVYTRIQPVGGMSDPFPPVRGGRRTRNLDAVRDRLAYRCATLGLIDRRTFGALRFTEGLPSGEDLVFSLTLAFTAQRLAYDLYGPAYLIHNDAVDRVTSQLRPLSVDFEFLDELERQSWFQEVDQRARTSIVVKMIRLQLFDAIFSRTKTQELLDENRVGLLAMLDRFERMAPGASKLLARADHAVFAQLRDPHSTPETLERAIKARYLTQALPALKLRYAHLGLPALFPKNLALTLHNQGPARTLLAGFLIHRRHY